MMYHQKKLASKATQKGRGHGKPAARVPVDDLSKLIQKGVQLQQAGQVQEAETFYGQVLDAQPDHADANHLSGLIADQLGNRELAIQLIFKAIHKDPGNAVFYRNLGILLQKQGQLEDAVASYHKAIALKPDYADAYSNLGIALHKQGQLEDAVAWYHKAIALKPDYAEAHNNLGITLQEQGQLEDAVASYNKAIALKPNYADAYSNLGIALQKQGQLEDAVACYHKAIALKPDYAGAYNNLGIALQKQGQLEDAVACYHKAITLKPDYAEAHYNLANLLQEQEQLAGAVASYHKAITLKPNYAGAYNNLGITLKKQGQLEDAVACYHKALALKPDYADAYNNLGIALQKQGQLEDAVACYHEALALKPDFAEAYSNKLFIYNYMTNQTPEEATAEARRYGVMVDAKATRIATHPNAADPDRRLNIGLVSGDLREHPVGYFLESVLSCLDRQSVSLTLYPTSHKVDALTLRLQEMDLSWHSLVGLNGEQAAQRIQDDGIDILLDLSGHTAHNRLPMFAQKPSPVQATWLGYFATTGLQAMDYILCDKHVIPAAETGHFVEQPYYLPDSYLCFTPPGEAIAVGPLPALTHGGLTFGCFNNLTKMNETVVLVWAQILRQVPGATLFLKTELLNTDAVRQTTQARFAAQGIDAARLILEGPAPRAELLAAYNRVDIALDPFPYPGGTTSLEALWMGVPVLSRHGDRFVSHLGESILHSMGLPDWIAADHEDYVIRAIKYAAGLPQLAALRATLRPQLLASPLCDAPRFARHLEAAFRDMWHAYCTKSQEGQG